jgi:tetratricopeptide (TPR) repeat protein
MRLVIASFVIVCACLPARAAAGRILSGPASQAIDPARSGLDVVPMPRLDGLEPAVQDHLRQSRETLENATARGAGSGAIGAAYGALARVFHAYELFESAEPAYRNAMRLASGDATWRYLLGYLYQQTGRLQDAAEQYEAAMRLQPDWRTTAVRLGEVYLQLNRLSDARDQFQSAVATFPSVARNGLGEIALRENRYGEAIDHFRAVLERVPTATSVHYSLAMAYRGAGRADDARAELERRGPGTVRMADPTVDNLQSLVRGERLLVIHGKRLYDAGQFDAAAETFRRALDVSPDSAAARGNLGLALSQLGRLDEAVQHLQRAFTDAPDDGAIRSTLVRALLRLSRYDEAIVVLRRVASLDPDHEESVVSLAILLSNRGRFGEALMILEQAEQRRPNATAIATTLSRLLASSPDRSLRDGTRALTLAMRVFESSQTAADAETVALALTELQRCEEARDWMQRAIAVAESSDELARLRRELSNYPTDACRRP